MSGAHRHPLARIGTKTQVVTGLVMLLLVTLMVYGIVQDDIRSDTKRAQMATEAEAFLTGEGYEVTSVRCDDTLCEAIADGEVRLIAVHEEGATRQYGVVPYELE